MGLPEPAPIAAAYTAFLVAQRRGMGGRFAQNWGELNVSTSVNTQVKVKLLPEI